MPQKYAVDQSGSPIILNNQDPFNKPISGMGGLQPLKPIQQKPNPAAQISSPTQLQPQATMQGIQQAAQQAQAKVAMYSHSNKAAVGGLQCRVRALLQSIKQAGMVSGSRKGSSIGSSSSAGSSSLTHPTSDSHTNRITGGMVGSSVGRSSGFGLRGGSLGVGVGRGGSVGGGVGSVGGGSVGGGSGVGGVGGGPGTGLPNFQPLFIPSNSINKYAASLAAAAPPPAPPGAPGGPPFAGATDPMMAMAGGQIPGGAPPAQGAPPAPAPAPAPAPGMPPGAAPPGMPMDPNMGGMPPAPPQQAPGQPPPGQPIPGTSPPLPPPPPPMHRRQNIQQGIERLMAIKQRKPHTRVGANEELKNQNMAMGKLGEERPHFSGGVNIETRPAGLPVLAGIMANSLGSGAMLGGAVGLGYGAAKRRPFYGAARGVGRGALTGLGGMAGMLGGGMLAHGLMGKPTGNVGVGTGMGIGSGMGIGGVLGGLAGYGLSGLALGDGNYGDEEEKKSFDLNSGFWEKEAALPPWLAKLIYTGGLLADLSGNFGVSQGSRTVDPPSPPPMVRPAPKLPGRVGPRPGMGGGGRLSALAPLLFSAGAAGLGYLGNKYMRGMTNSQDNSFASALKRTSTFPKAASLSQRVQALKQAAQTGDTMQRSASGESKNLSFNHKPDDYMQGQAAWASVSGYFKGKKYLKNEPDPFKGKHSGSQKKAGSSAPAQSGASQAPKSSTPKATPKKSGTPVPTKQRAPKPSVPQQPRPQPTQQAPMQQAPVPPQPQQPQQPVPPQQPQQPQQPKQQGAFQQVPTPPTPMGQPQMPQQAVAVPVPVPTRQPSVREMVDYGQPKLQKQLTKGLQGPNSYAQQAVTQQAQPNMPAPMQTAPASPQAQALSTPKTARDLNFQLAMSEFITEGAYLSR